ncbi:MAG: protein-L-isoaspartate(D-aspartate) O-methyltransferase [Saprospirales bacterium]|nr:protein-L-isoaspartate(D-aspartate) O-methyltransferase [Saprospirales bacterium]MBK8923346.1 protein-L-isoaspartate(D-aspartate) O-methyltransferase [Saprospirales bacterium]
MTDTYRHKGLRKRLVDALRKRGIADEAVLAAIDAVPRHFFLDKAFEEHAYEDKPFPIGHEQTISQPYTVAYMTALLEVKRGERVLEIGTGSGYQAAVLAAMGARVFTVERQEALYLHARALLAETGFSSVRCFFKDGARGLPEYAPYHKIIVTAGAPVVPEPLKEQLAVGGLLIIPVGEDVQYMYRIERLSETEYKEEVLDAFRFVPFLEGVQKKKGDKA